MTGLPEAVRDTLVAAESVSAAGDRTYEVTSTPFEAQVVVSVDGEAPPDGTASAEGTATTFDVTVEVPTLSAAVEGEVADVVEEGWLETFERRLADAAMPLAGTDAVDPSVEVLGASVWVEVTLTDADPARGAADAVALVEYVEGTYMEGVVPGYDYRDPVRSLREAARQRHE